MSKPLQILIAEDNALDAKLLIRALQQAGIEFEHQWVQTEADYLKNLRGDLDIILSDFDMPQFGGLRALQLLKERKLEVPFIIISGTIGEDVAVTVMKQGANDYLLKDRLARLGPAINQAVEQGRMRKERRRTEKALRESEERFREVVQNIEEVFWMTSVDKSEMLFVSAAYEKIWGRTCASLYAKPMTWLEAIHQDDRDRIMNSAMKNQVDSSYSEEYRVVRPDGTVRWIRDRAFPVRDASGAVYRVAGVAEDITERREAQKGLELFRKLVDQSNDTFEVVDPKTGRFLDVNAKGPAELGYTREEYLSFSVHEIDSTVGAADWPQLVERMRAAGTFTGEGSHRRKDGTEIPIEVNAKLVQLDREYIVATARDITERKKAEGVLRESERRFREMLENVEMIAVTVDRHGTITFCNDYLLKLSGWKRSEVIGCNWFTQFIPDSPEVLQSFERIFEIGSFPTHYENPIRIRDGGSRHIVWNNTILRDADGGVVGLASLGEDVTERRQAEERVREQAAMLDLAHDAIIVRDFRTRKITFWNKGAETLYGWKTEEALGRDIGDLICIDPKGPDEICDQLLKSDEWRGEVGHRTKGGKKLTVSCRATLVRDAAGQGESVLSINTDITEQKSLEARFLRAQRMESIGTLASGVAHDLNNILSPILMSVPMLKRDLQPALRDQIIETVEMSATRGAAIVKQVLAFGRGVEGERCPLQIGSVIREIMKIMQETFPKDIFPDCSLPRDLWLVIGDATQFHQVLLNLCVNARDAMPSGGRLAVRASNVELDESFASMLPGATPGPNVLIEVQDSGAGIPAEIMERIFDPFFTTKGIGKGTGLGLSTVLGIVKSHGGHINVSSEPGRGTTFQIYLPAVPEAEAGLEEKSRAPEIPEGTGQVILVVDDEEQIRRSTRLALEGHGYTVLLAADGTEALTVFTKQSSSVSLVLTDLMMPYMDGLALIHVLRKIEPGIRVMASTGLGSKAQLSELQQLGVTTILKKPYGSETLLKSVHAVLAAPVSIPTPNKP